MSAAPLTYKGFPAQWQTCHGSRMAPRGYLTFGDIEGKLDVLRVECTSVRNPGTLAPEPH
jgi:hypothetical protein